MLILPIGIYCWQNRPRNYFAINDKIDKCCLFLIVMMIMKYFWISHEKGWADLLEIDVHTVHIWYRYLALSYTYTLVLPCL